MLRWPALAIAAVLLVGLGCQAKTPPPTLDYSPDNVRLIRELQQLADPAPASPTPSDHEEDA